MKKILSVFCILLAFSLLAPLCYAGDNTDTFRSWGIRITVPEGAKAVLEGDEYYIYANPDGGMPYVMLRPYRYDSAESFLADFTDYMRGQYADLTVTSEAAPRTIGDKRCLETEYHYSVSGYDVTDRRIAVKHGERVYMFASKEVAELGKLFGSALDDVVAESVFLTEETPQTAQSPGFAGAYLCCLDNGMPKYWLDLSGLQSDDPILHCYFRSSDPTFYESSFRLVTDPAAANGGVYTVTEVYDQYGLAHGNWFKTLRFYLDGEDLILEVERDEKTLAGGGEDNILTGSYRMAPVGIAYTLQYRKENGQLKYWLGADGENLQLHALFVSGDPTPYERVFTLDLPTARRDSDGGLVIEKVTDMDGRDVSDWFKTLRLFATEEGIVMEVERDESTLAGGAGDNILTGRYLFKPKAFFRPLSDGPYTAEELKRLAQIHYFITTGFYPPEADAEKNPNGSYTVHLYENVKLEDISHTATSAWYAVGANGVGVDLITGESVNLIPSGVDRMN